MNAILKCLGGLELKMLDERLAEEIARPIAAHYLPDRIEARREIAAEILRRREDLDRRIEATRAEEAAAVDVPED